MRGKLLALVVLLVTVAVAYGGTDTGLACSIRCQHIEDDTQWDQCMLHCHRSAR